MKNKVYIPVNPKLDKFAKELRKNMTYEEKTIWYNYLNKIQPRFHRQKIIGNYIVDFYCVTNMLHPFREGNGRTQRIFIAQLIRFCGYDINFSEIDPDDLMIATIHSANGITGFLKDIFSKHIIDKK